MLIKSNTQMSHIISHSHTHSGGFNLQANVHKLLIILQFFNKPAAVY